MGEDIKVFRFLAIKNEKDIPVNAFLFSLVLSLGFIYSSTFEQVLLYTTFLLILITTITVAGVFILRRRNLEVDESAYRTWGYPYTSIIFIFVSVGTLVFVAIDKPFESLVSMMILAIGLVIYSVSDRKEN